MADDNTADKQKINSGPQWKPGQSGNPAGRPKKGETLTDAMREYLSGAEPGTDLTRKDMLVRKVAKLAYDGDMVAIRLLWNYIDGMPKQSLDLGGAKSIKVDFIDADTVED